MLDNVARCGEKLSILNLPVTGAHARLLLKILGSVVMRDGGIFDASYETGKLPCLPYLIAISMCHMVPCFLCCHLQRRENKKQDKGSWKFCFKISSLKLILFLYRENHVTYFLHNLFVFFFVTSSMKLSERVLETRESLSIWNMLPR